MASSRGHVDCAGVLIDASVELDFQDKWGNTALHMAIRRHYSPVAMQLLHAGADFDIVNCVSALCDVSSYLIRRHSTCNMMALFMVLKYCTVRDIAQAIRHQEMLSLRGHPIRIPSKTYSVTFST